MQVHVTRLLFPVPRSSGTVLLLSLETTTSFTLTFEKIFNSTLQQCRQRQPSLVFPESRLPNDSHDSDQPNMVCQRLHYNPLHTDVSAYRFVHLMINQAFHVVSTDD